MYIYLHIYTFENHLEHTESLYLQMQATYFSDIPALNLREDRTSWFSLSSISNRHFQELFRFNRPFNFGSVMQLMNMQYPLYHIEISFLFLFAKEHFFKNNFYF